MMSRIALLAIDLIVNILVLALQQTSAPPAEPPQQQTASEAPRYGPLQEVIAFERFQPTGITVSKSGRIFVCFPKWSDDYQFAVVEVLQDGKVKPYPDEQWNTGHGSVTSPSDVGDPRERPRSAGEMFVCVQSVWADDRDRLWILDAASPRMERVVPGGPKLISVNLSDNTIDKVIRFGDDIAPPRSYLNDVRVDAQRRFAYITDSGMGAILVVNLDTGQARRLLSDHPSTKAEPDVRITVQGVELLDEKTGKTPEIHSDGIALSSDGAYLYYHALTGRSLYRVPTEVLRSESLARSAPDEAVELVSETTVTDGMLIDEKNRIYHTVIGEDSIVWFDHGSHRGQTIAKDERIAWPDSMAFGPDGSLYFTTSQIHRMPRFNDGKDTRTAPYHVFKLAKVE